uniref:3-hydroxyacyl-CoA dehydrogenase family protein n=1 Tax=candidate division WOR-3 bacterium TaxID=2052148 RepID=A0A7V0Z655_UNCW3
MNLDERLLNVSVIGAAGKMGSGIAALVAQEMLRLKFENPERIYRLNLIDVSEKGLDGLRDYLKSQFLRTAEKTIVSLRDRYKDRADLVENAEIVDAYVNDGMKLLNFGADLAMAKNSHLIFEAIIEDEKVKIKTYKSLKRLVSKETFFLTNTSSIPIGYLDEKSDLDGRLIGYHFYNPPVVQKLVEVICSKHTRNELKDIANELGKSLRKKLVPANDISGFIGNGHFMRDGLFALDEVLQLKGKYKLTGAIYIINRVSQDFLLRPMGIFQLIDYVGIDVFQCILRVMRTHLGDDTLKHKLIDKMIKNGIKGGQYPDGSQKDGFLKYDKNRPVGIYDLKKGEYFIITDDWKKKLDRQLGPLPEGFAPWKALLGDKDKEAKLKNHFSALKNMNTFGAELALNYLKKTKEIAENLVKQRVANSSDDVNAVLTNGFYWLYGPINDYI